MQYSLKNSLNHIICPFSCYRVPLKSFELSLSLSASRLASYSCVFFVGFVNVYVLCKCLCYHQGKEIDTVTGWRCTLFLCTLVLIFFFGGWGGGGGNLVQSLKLSLNTVLTVMMSESKICWSHSKLIKNFMV